MSNKGLYTVLVSLVVALGGFLLGFDSAVISGAVPFIEKFFVLNSIQLGWAVSCLIFGAMAGNALAGPMSDLFGRKPVLIITSVLFTVSAITSALAQSFWFFIVARIIGGIGVGGALLIAPIYIAEIAPPERRGRLVTFNQLNIVIGISAAYWSNYFLVNLGANNWRWMLGVESVPAVLYFIFLFMVPRSPRWLVVRGRDEQALSVMEKVGGAEYAKKSLQTIKEHLKVVQDKAKFPALFTKKMSYIMVIAFGIAFFQQITGINAILYYAPVIFKQAGGGTQAAFMQAVVIGLANFLFTIVAFWLIDKLGRKPLLLIGSFVMAVSLFINAGAFQAANYQLTPETINKIENVPQEIIVKLKNIENQEFKSQNEFLNAVEIHIGSADTEKYRSEIANKALKDVNALLVLIAIIGFIAAFAISLGPVMWALLSEIFPNQLRGLAISVVGFFNSLVSFTVTLVFPWELWNLGPAATYLIYGIFAALTFVFVIRFVPETKGKSLEELETILVKS